MMVGRPGRLAAAGEDVQDNLVAGGPRFQRFADRGLDRIQAIGHDCCQHAHEATIGLVTGAELAPQARQRRRQLPALERRAIAKRAGLARQHRQVMPGIVDRPVTPKVPGMLGHDSITATHDVIRSA